MERLAEQVFRSRVDQWTLRVGTGVLLAFMLMSIAASPSPTPPVGIVVVSLGASGFVWFSWRYGVWARVVVAADEVRVVNLLRVHHVPFDLVQGIRPGSWAARLALTDGIELTTWGMATARIEDTGGAAAGRRSLFMQAVRRARRRSRSPRRELLTRWQPELWVVLVVAVPVASLMLVGDRAGS